MKDSIDQCWDFRYNKHPDKPFEYRVGWIPGVDMNEALRNLIKQDNLTAEQVKTVELTETKWTWQDFVDHGNTFGWD